jgi:hypothetical protein
MKHVYDVCVCVCLYVCLYVCLAGELCVSVFPWLFVDYCLVFGMNLFHLLTYFVLCVLVYNVTLISSLYSFVSIYIAEQ